MKRKLPARVLLALALLIFASACASTHYLAPMEGPEIVAPRKLHIVLSDGHELELHHCFLETDRLVGFRKGGGREEIAFDSITALYVRNLNPAVYPVAALTAGAVVVGIWLARSAADAPSSNP